MRLMAVQLGKVRAVIFDWGGTLTPWHTVDHEALWLGVCAQHLTAGQAEQAAAAIYAAERELWQLSEREQRSATMDEVFRRAGITATEAFLATYFQAWDPHTLTDTEAIGLLTRLRAAGLKIGVLSNTMWPRSRHEEIFQRDGMLPLIDGAVYSSEIDWAKPHPAAFRAAMTAIGVDDPGGCVFVGDRPFDDIHGAKSAGLRAVLLANSEVPPFDDVVPDAVISRLSELVPLIDAWNAAG